MKCLYCRCEVSSESPVGVCYRCGVKVWGEKMFNAIVSGMSIEKEKGNMELGRVSEEAIGALGAIQNIHRVLDDNRGL